MPDSHLPSQTGPDDALEADLQRLRHLPPAAPTPFLFTRVQARLDATATKTGALPWWLQRPAYLVAVLILLVAINMGAVLHFAYQRTVASTTATTPLDSFASEYQLTPYVVAYE
ncbi:hypothetical protein H8B15_12560 [Hymenobacter sp. BT507]|uniref:Uncharacterized protein n=1 Tax=Hymenobacter citatus TaxID=2763506 RepID=A0ABR7MLI5_9BACT|nr:hypothetical protein [Hymenobacter citatus]MBC6611759.1 hypothetical protein [Hymenobacter citatus]